MTPITERKLIVALDHLQETVHANAVAHGFHEPGTNPAVYIALMHSELSEALEALRKGDPESTKIPGFRHLEEELADAVIRIFDFAGREDLNLSRAIVEKHKYNKSRPFKHGKKF